MKRLLEKAFIMVCFFFAVAISSPVLAVTISEPQLLTHTSVNVDTFSRSAKYSIDGDNMVWADMRNGNSDIYYYNLKTHETVQLTNDLADQVQAVVQGNRVVWKDWSTGHAQVYLYDLITRQATYIADMNLPSGSYSSANFWGADLDGDLIVWSDYRNNAWEVVVYNIATQETQQITAPFDGISRMRFSSVDQNKIAYCDGVYRNVYLYDYNTGEKRVITNYTQYSPFRPHLGNNYITWQIYNPTTHDYDIAYYDLTTNQESVLVSGPGNQRGHGISGGKMIFENDVSGNSDIYLYDFSTGSSELIVNTSVYEESPRMQGNQIFWLQENANRTWDIYTATIDAPSNETLDLQATILGQNAAYLITGMFSPAEVTLVGIDNTKAVYTASPWTIQDARGTGSGWYATISSDDPRTSDGSTINKANLRLFVTGVSKAVGAQTSSDANKLQVAEGVSMDTVQTLVYAPQGEGMGTFSFIPSMELSLPANAYAGNYTTTIYVSMYENAPVL